jgi:hypothetical protein
MGSGSDKNSYGSTTLMLTSSFGSRYESIFSSYGSEKPDTGYPVRARYWISGRILGLTNIFVKYLPHLKTALQSTDIFKQKKHTRESIG